MPVSDATKPEDAAMIAAAPTASIAASLSWTPEELRLDEEQQAHEAWFEYACAHPRAWDELN